ncbi:ATP-binding protein [Pediococcus acidilactici]|uniref:ATP-binding protein n=1 Tax=Pediococcus acidilactici TaxID=1254 RepID=UPI001EE4AF19|nr:AAA family ATPase [Pediococcus acidilactici]
MILIAPSGAGKTMLLSYLAGMLLKQGHILSVIDAKNTAFGAVYKSIGIQTAVSPDEIIMMLANLVREMEQDYKKYFSDKNISISSNFSTLKLPAHVLIFDEVLSALDSGDKKQKQEMIKLLKLLALKGRMAGYVIVLTSQRLLSTDLPKSVTEQCQTRLIMGANVSEELFHTLTGMYKKDLGRTYIGEVGKGYAVTPTTGLTYFEAPYMDFKKYNFREIMKKMKERGANHGKSG